MNNKTVILMAGKKRAGKDFASDILCNAHSFKKVAFARKIKEAACAISGLTYDELEYLKNEKKEFIVVIEDYYNRVKEQLWVSYNELYPNDGTSEYENFKNNLALFDFDSLTHGTIAHKHSYIFDARIFLQEMGGMWKVIFNDEQIWAKLAIAEMLSIKEDIIISDFRYPQEFELVFKYFPNVSTVKLIGKNCYESDEYDKHSSETALNNYRFNYQLNNTIWQPEVLPGQISGLLKEINNGN